MKFLKIVTTLVGVLLLTSCQPPQGESDSGKKQVTILGVMTGKDQEKIEKALPPLPKQRALK